tara:strand:- start:16025 stop:16198 length:174 start_codon:yes stop_codon:yes gene_type:complete
MGIYASKRLRFNGKWPLFVKNSFISTENGVFFAEKATNQRQIVFYESEGLRGVAFCT